MKSYLSTYLIFLFIFLIIRSGIRKLTILDMLLSIFSFSAGYWLLYWVVCLTGGIK